MFVRVCCKSCVAVAGAMATRASSGRLCAHWINRRCRYGVWAAPCAAHTVLTTTIAQVLATVVAAHSITIIPRAVCVLRVLGVRDMVCSCIV